MTDPTDDNPFDFSRPVGLGLIVLVGVVHGALTAAVGLFVLLDRSDDALQAATQLSSSQLAGVGVAAIVGGLIHVGLSSALGRGSETVRLLFGLVTLLNVSAAFWAVVGTHGEQRLSASVALVVGLWVLWVLYGSGRSERFFEHSR